VIGFAAVNTRSAPIVSFRYRAWSRVSTTPVGLFAFVTSPPSTARSGGESGGPGHGSHWLDSHAYSVTTAPGCFCVVWSNSDA
jgi:hypothetical protein